MTRQRPVLGASIAAFRDGQVCLVRRARPPFQGLWSLPGGRVRLGERAREAALRELAEETGLRAPEATFLMRHPVLDETSQRMRAALMVFHARDVSGAPRAGDDAAEAGFFAPGVVARLDTTPQLHDIVVRAIATPW